MSKREELREKRRIQEKRKKATAIILVSLIVVALAAGFILPGVINSMSPIGPVTQITPEPRPQANRNSMGDPNAPVKVEEFSDFQCPYCRDYVDKVEPKIISEFIATGKVYFTYTPFNIITGTQESNNAAKAAYCAADQGKFWEYHDILFANQGAENSGQYTDRRLTAYGQSIGLDMNQFQGCYNSQKYQNQIAVDQAKANGLGVNSTPSFAINGKLIDADITTIEAAIKTAVDNPK